MDDQSAPGQSPELTALSPSPSSEAAQPYRVLARKYRPKTFAELIGQEALVRTLSNALESSRLAHAFLLPGVRGVGKTHHAPPIPTTPHSIAHAGTAGHTPHPCHHV